MKRVTLNLHQSWKGQRQYRNMSKTNPKTTLLHRSIEVKPVQRVEHQLHQQRKRQPSHQKLSKKTPKKSTPHRTTNLDDMNSKILIELNSQQQHRSRKNCTPTQPLRSQLDPQQKRTDEVEQEAWEKVEKGQNRLDLMAHKFFINSAFRFSRSYLKKLSLFYCMQE